MKFVLCLIVILVAGCTENSIKQEPESDNAFDNEEEKYWNDFKKWSKGTYEEAKSWSSESYKSSKEWIAEKYPETKKWGEEAIEKIGAMASDYGEKLKSVEINMFSLEDDVKFGQEVYNEIQQNNSAYKILDKSSNQDTYNRVENIVEKILSSGNVEHAKDFDWQITILDDETVNAMCAPGGFIFVYTGLLEFAENDSQLAGVLAHEIAHADKRHGTRQLTAVYGIQFLLNFLSKGETSMGTQIALGLLNLKHSRDHERQADEYSVKYLCHSDYEPNGVALFFSRFEGQSSNILSDLTSTHPNHQERISNVNRLVEENLCN